MISHIVFFIDTCRAIQPHYLHANVEQKNQLITFLKTWIFYNSGSKQTFWTGFYTEEGLYQTKEHWFPGKPVVQRLMSDPNLSINSKRELVLRIFKYMQWNYTTQQQNQALRPYQTEQHFFNEPINGEPRISYQLAGINLLNGNNHVNQFPILDNFIRSLQQKDIVIQFTLKKSYRIAMLEQSEFLNIPNVILFGDKYVLFSGSLKKLQMLLFRTFSSVKSETDVLNFCAQFGPNPPIRREAFADRNFTIPRKGRGFNDPNPLNGSTHRGAIYLFPWFQKIIDKLDGDWVAMDYNLNLHREYNFNET